MTLKEQILQLRSVGISYREIERQLGCSRSLISYHCSKRLGHQDLVAELQQQSLELRQDHLQLPAEKQEACDWLILAQVSRKDIADALDLDYRTVLKRATTLNSVRQPIVEDGYLHVKRRRQHLKMLGVAMLGMRCERCQYNRCIRALEFHHLDPVTKDFTIGGATCRSWRSLKAELKKCSLLCANCHREAHDEA